MTGVRLVQLARGTERFVAAVEEPRLVLLSGIRSVYDLVARAGGTSIGAVVAGSASAERLQYDDVYEGRSEYRLLPCIDHPESAWRTMVSGTGLTHLASVKRRDAMHAAIQQETDSMRMYRWGVEGGKPALGAAGTAPEWFYKGNGRILRGHGEALQVPAFAEDGGEEPEIAGVYIVDAEGVPRRVGLTTGNEFSDHRFEKRNYLYLAHSKLRTCAIGPELVVDAGFENVPGEVRVERAGSAIWRSAIRSGEANMCHSLANMEHHHFKYEQHRVPGDVHVHFFGADAFSFGDDVELQDGDVMQVAFEGFGRALRNPVRRAEGPEVFWGARPVAL